MLEFNVQLAAPSAILAGMGSPFPLLTEAARMRLDAISFFLAGVLLSALVVKWLWNHLAADFRRWPWLSYPKALGAVLLWGLASFVVLTMISGARELMTPGAWRQQGVTYQLAEEGTPDANRTSAGLANVRRDALDELLVALERYAYRHDGRFPETIDASGLRDDVWWVPDKTGRRRAGVQYLYVPGGTLKGEARVAAYEPAIYGDGQYVLFTDGKIRRLDSNELAEELNSIQSATSTVNSPVNGGTRESDSIRTN